MARARPRPVCFVAMPFGRKAPPGREEPVIDFDVVFSHVERAVIAEGLECIRADFELDGGFIHKPMYERLLIAEYVVADLTFANPNVAYQVGVRHGASTRPTILIGAEDFLGELPVYFRPRRVMHYVLGDDGLIDAAHGAGLEAALRQRLRAAIEGSAPIDNPIMQVTGWEVAGRLEHDKTDVFLDRLAFVGEIGERIRSALATDDREAAVDQLAGIEHTLTEGGAIVAELHSALLGVYLGYREQKAYQNMVDMVPRMPPELQATPVVQEQLALALNRLAEASDRDAAGALEAEDETGLRAARSKGREFRSAAISALEDIDESVVTAETWGVRGRIYKGWYDAAIAEGDTTKAAAMLSRAIETYESGVRADMRDYYPGVNAVTLRLIRAEPADLEALEQLVPVVRMAVGNAPPAGSEEERYWQAATKLELASAAKDWEAANDHLVTALGLDVHDWMHDTTVKNLQIHRRAFQGDAAAVQQIDRLIAGLAV